VVPRQISETSSEKDRMRTTLDQPHIILAEVLKTNATDRC